MTIRGATALGGMLLCRYDGREEFYDGLARLAELDVSGEDAHSWILQRDVELVMAAAARFDPDGLLNPGKLPVV